MRKFIIALFSTAACTTAAHAEPFSGFYVGAQVTRDAYEVKAEDVDLGGTFVNFDGLSGNGVGGGVYVGYDYLVTPDIFIGAEASASLSSASASASLSDGTDSFGAKVKARESFGLSGRLGYKLTDSTGLYARLGWQSTRFKTRVYDTTETPSTLFSDKRTEDAFVYGAGLETSVGDSTSIRVEYVIEDYGSAGLKSDLGVSGIRVDNNKLSLGVSYRF